ncbi:hypothetical protein Scep_013774 [Stephania cephalantha]|uniref:Mediator complex subunit 15 KIX domain-containing protein n=1 Tax=Stephania cephalantha TaxID=152367 RepID=A0AAP0NZQ5_9MAGN
MEAGDWRNQVQPESRSRIVNKIMEALKKHLPITGPEGLVELQKIATRFEEKIYNAANDQSDYLRKISLKMLTMETKYQSTNGPNSLQPSSDIGNQNPSDSGSLGMQAQVLNQGQQIHLPNQSQPRQQMLPQNPITSAGIQSSGGLPSALSSVNGLSQLQSQPQMGLPQPQNQLQRDSTLQPQGVIEQKPFQPQRAVPDASSTTMDSTGLTRNPNSMDWQEEIYQKFRQCLPNIT